MDWTEVPGSEDIKNIGTRKQLFLDDEIIETRRWITPSAFKSAAFLVETPGELEEHFDLAAKAATSTPNSPTPTAASSKALATPSVTTSPATPCATPSAGTDTPTSRTSSPYASASEW